MSDIVLVYVDDDEDLSEMLSEDLAECFDVNVFNKPEDALVFLEEHKNEIKILLTDFMMPGMTGLELIKRVKVFAPHVHAVMLTGYSNALNDGSDTSVCDMILDKNEFQDVDDLIDRLTSF